MDLNKLRHITTFIFDVDGVFTDGNVLVTESGEMLRVMSTRDGQAVRYAIEAGYRVFIITKGFSEGVRKRFEFLGVTQIYDKLKEKSSALDEILVNYQLQKEAILYMGDDLPDLPLFSKVSVACCPSDAVPEIIESAHYISAIKGGQGCVREIIEKVMHLQGTWPGSKSIGL